MKKSAALSVLHPDALIYLLCVRIASDNVNTDRNYMKCTKLLLQKFQQYATKFVFFMDEKVFSVAAPNNRQIKVSGRLWELLKKLSVFFGVGTAQSAAHQ